MLIRQVVRDLSSQPLRTFLTLLALAWGTLCVSLLIGFGEGYELQTRRTQAAMGEGLVIIWPSRTSMPFEGTPRGRPLAVTNEDIEALRASVPGIDAISSEHIDYGMKLTYGTKTRGVPLSAVLPEFGPMRNVTPQPGGRFINPIDMQLRRRVVFLGNDVAELVFGNEPAVGKRVELNGLSFLVIGVMLPKNQQSTYEGHDRKRVFVPQTTLEAIRGRQWMDVFVFSVTDLTNSDAVLAQVRQVMARRHQLHPEDEEVLKVWNTVKGMEFQAAYLLAIKSFLLLIGGLTMLVAGIGVFNVMTVVMEERTREIGIKMALGARPGTIVNHFMVETTALVALGGALGLAAAHGVVAGFPLTGLVENVGSPELSVNVVLKAAAVLGLVAGVAGYLPARAAARIDPVRAMKVE